MKAPTGKLAFAYRTISELEAERDQLRAEVEALRKDAGRINFMEEYWFFSPQWGSWSFAYREDWEKPGSTLRAAIDAAMAAKEGEL